MTALTCDKRKPCCLSIFLSLDLSPHHMHAHVCSSVHVCLISALAIVFRMQRCVTCLLEHVLRYSDSYVHNHRSQRSARRRARPACQLTAQI